MNYTLSLAQVRKFSPCTAAFERVSALLPARGKISAAKARELGCTYGDIIWIASAVAMDDEALARRLTHYLNDNAKAVLHIWERRFPDDDRPRKAIEACDGFLAGEVSEEDWKIAARDAWYAWYAWAARAAWYARAAWAARDARDAWAAWDARAAWAAWDARDAFHAWQFDRLIYWLSEADPVPLPMPAKGVPALIEEAS